MTTLYTLLYAAYIHILQSSYDCLSKNQPSSHFHFCQLDYKIFSEAQTFGIDEVMSDIY